MVRWVVGFAITLIAALVAAQPAEERRAIARAKRIYTRTNAQLGQLHATRKALEGFSLEGGDMIAWTDADKVRKIEAHHFGEMWRGTNEFFFDASEHLCFIVETVARYADTFGPVSSANVRRFYLLDGKIVASSPDPSRDPAEVADHLPRLLVQAEELLAGAHRPANPVVSRRR